MSDCSAVKPKKIMFNIYGLERGGPEMRLLDFAMNFPPDLEVHICVTSNNLSLLSDFQKSKARISVIPITRAYLELRNVRKILDYVRKNEISVINSFDLKGLFISALAKICRGKKIKVVHHFIDLQHNYKYRTKIALGGLIRAADVLVCNSDAVRNEVIGTRFGDARVRVIHNGVDQDHFAPNPGRKTADRASAGLNGRHFVLGTVANFRPEKNYPFLIGQFRELSAVYPHLRLVCVGGGPLLDEARGIVQKYSLDEKVIFTGYVNDVRKYLGMMDAFTLCSLKEGFPNAVLQAMSMGLPVVCSAVGECKEIITDAETGLLFNPRDAKRFQQAMCRIIEDENLRELLSGMARNLVETRFSLRQMIEKYVGFYMNI
jgi:glycosyltransferase involved in cell wall biosynthesis